MGIECFLLLHAFPLVFLLRKISGSHVGYSAIMAVIGVTKQLRIGYELTRRQSGNRYGFNLKLKKLKNSPWVTIPVSSPGLVPDSANRSSGTYTDSSLSGSSESIALRQE